MNDIYIINEESFISELDTDIYVSVGDTNYKVSKNVISREQIDNVLYLITSGSTVNEEDTTFKFLYSLGVILKRTVARTIKLFYQDDPLNRKIKLLLDDVTNIVSYQERGMLLKLISNGDYLLLYPLGTTYFNNIHDDIIEISDMFAKYILQVLRSKKLDILNIPKGNCIIIDIRDYKLNTIIAPLEMEILSKKEDYFLFKEGISTIVYDYEIFYPFIMAKYRNIFGENDIGFGISKTECIDNIFFDITNVPVNAEKSEDEVSNSALYMDILKMYFPNMQELINKIIEKEQNIGRVVKKLYQYEEGSDNKCLII